MTQRQVRINDIYVTYYEQGKGQPVLFLHGGRLRATTFRSTLQMLSRHYRVIAPDIPGYGDSSTPSTPWTYREYASFIHKFIKHLKLKNVIVIGYSMGGGIAYHLASMNKDIAQLILIDAAGIEKSSITQSQRDMHRISFYFTHPQYFGALCTLLKEYLLFAYKHIHHLSYIRRLRKSLEDSSSYAEVTVKTHIIWAKNDAIFPVEIAHKLHTSIKNSTIQIIDETHDWAIYNDKQFNNVLIQKCSM